MQGAGCRVQCRVQAACASRVRGAGPYLLLSEEVELGELGLLQLLLVRRRHGLLLIDVREQVGLVLALRLGDHRRWNRQLWAGTRVLAQPPPRRCHPNGEGSPLVPRRQP